ncbi:MAG: beta-ketoacyl-[acyl-carrier-protein] synthase family protein [Acidobacteriota bacterium]
MADSIVVTGIGVVSPVGIGHAEFWSRLLAGESGIAPVTAIDTSAYRVHNGGEVKDFDPREHGADPTWGRASQLAVAAARLALADAGLSAGDWQPERAGVAMGTTSGEPREIEAFNDRFVADDLDREAGELMARYPSHVIAGQVAAAVDFVGLNTMLPAACAAGNYAIGFAYDALLGGRADLMLAGGADAFSRMTFTGFARLGAVAPDVCRPFDRHRQGMIPGEGATLLVLEPLAAARARGARIYAQVAGYGLSCDAHHMTAAHPAGDGAAAAMERALEDARTAPEEVAYISAHGTGTPTNDRLETLAVHQAFGELGRTIPVSSVKSMLGHTMGAASAMEAAVCALAVADGKIPPTINFEEPDPECDLDCVPNVARELPVPVALNNASAFGGNNASVVFRRVPS